MGLIVGRKAGVVVDVADAHGLRLSGGAAIERAAVGRFLSRKQPSDVQG